MARIIVDAGPLIAFAKVNQTDLFHHLFGEVWVTSAVQEECMAKPCAEHRALRNMMQEDWVNICNPVGRDQPLSLSLGDGERDSIHLALEDTLGSLLIMDDFLARKQAIRLELSMMGTARMLYIAEQHDFISNAEMVISDMRKHGYRISMAILDEIRRERH